MTGARPFSIDAIDTLIETYGPIHYEPDLLNGAHELFYAPDMREAAEGLVGDYERGSVAPRSVRISPKTTLPQGTIVGYRHPSGASGPYIDPVFVIRPSGRKPEPPVPEPEDRTVHAADADQPAA